MKVEEHKIGTEYFLVNRDGSRQGEWKIAYLPLSGSYKDGEWIDFKEPYALIEKPAIFEGGKGIDFREVPLRFLNKIE